MSLYKHAHLVVDWKLHLLLILLMMILLLLQYRCCSFPAFSTPFMGHDDDVVVDIMYVVLQIMSDDRAVLKQQHVHC
jgi:hypothetical protein